MRCRHDRPQPVERLAQAIDHPAQQGLPHRYVATGRFWQHQRARRDAGQRKKAHQQRPTIAETNDFTRQSGRTQRDAVADGAVYAHRFDDIAIGRHHAAALADGQRRHRHRGDLAGKAGGHAHVSAFTMRARRSAIPASIR